MRQWKPTDYFARMRLTELGIPRYSGVVLFTKMGEVHSNGRTVRADLECAHSHFTEEAAARCAQQMFRYEGRKALL